MATHGELMFDHDVKPGVLNRCQITGSFDLFEIIDLGHQAPCDSMLSKEMLDQRKRPTRCDCSIVPSRGLAQLDYVVDGREIYHPAYPYRSGIPSHGRSSAGFRGYDYREVLASKRAPLSLISDRMTAPC
jgi:hypothetical protein